ncbi:Ada metal-binding domain-containing protein [Pseudomonas sp. 6D_7.1_Bac1]|uniref:Ada metal-binding domain-containing protein n=1 Tax=Pseudomonas sp. 6D_7.1_Bac1 TaxID=2971615 RepID=UPI0021C7525F|nr:Ada metal-binding domain-containing protein [Pseudomonas sp. 6D_7.1_Bac1]MCU1750343.1 metal-binding protein [Pseudomonas sp. 6D_7.1_Bac1]
MKRFVLLNAQGEPVDSVEPGQLGGHRRSRIFGRLNCPAALHAIARGGYVAHRVFFADEATARAAGYRPCAVCLPQAYAQWKKGDCGFNRCR